MCSTAAEADRDPPRAGQGGLPSALPPGVAALCRIEGPCPAGDALDKKRAQRVEGMREGRANSGANDQKFAGG